MIHPRYVACTALVLFLGLASGDSEACLLARRLAAVAPHLTEEQVQKLAHDPSHRHVIPYKLDAPAPCVGGMADIFPCDNVDLLAFFSPSDLGGGNGNDLWGWTDPDTGKEYALMGLDNGTAFVDLSDPEAPVYLGRLPSHNGEVSIWRDVGVYANHAFIVADNVSNHGMQVFDLTQLRNVVTPPQTFTETAHYAGFARSHNIVVDDATGFAYAVGSDTCAGGLHIVDVRTPTAPVQAGCYSGDGYTHDAQCVVYQGPDVEHQGKEICFASNEDTLTIVDVTDKNTPLMLGRQGYENSGYVHQGWLTEDQRYFLIDDELDELFDGHNTRTYTYDVSDLDAPVVVGHFDATGASIDHNQYVKGQYSFQANYKRGLRVLHLDDPATAAMTEVAFLDTFPSEDSTGFDGAWSTYPFFASGVVLISDITRGLFVVRPHIGSATIFEDGFESGDASAWSSETP
jgi:choice-of-anchor B domain-containing protein